MLYDYLVMFPHHNYDQFGLLISSSAVPTRLDLAAIHNNMLMLTTWRFTEMAQKETMDTPQDPTAETGRLDTSDLEAVVGGNEPDPPQSGQVDTAPVQDIGDFFKDGQGPDAPPT
jgi:hypothetical protein